MPANLMDPIDLRTDLTLHQALQCVQYRLPKSTDLKPNGYLFALGLRYGLIGMSAAHHVLTTALEDQDSLLYGLMESWPKMVEDHVRWDMANRLPFSIESGIPTLIGRLALLPMRAYIPLFHNLYPLSQSLDLVADAICSEHRGMIFEGWPWLKRRHAMRSFKASLAESILFATYFAERRAAHLDEVPEIALIGE